ncbi:MAG: DNA translocase FtsK 4TM domain-containing protein [Actinomycetota bacterium]
MPATASKARTKTSARKGSTTRKSTPRKPAGRGRGYREIAGLGLIALGVFLGAVVFASIGGGAFGQYLEEFIRVFVGRGVGLAPLVMVAIGVHMIVRIPVFDARPFRIGAGVVGLAIVLGLASGLFGTGMDTAQGWFDMTEMQATGGVIGAGLWWATDSTIGAVGANILTVLGIAAGMVLMSGASLGEALRGSGRGVATAGAAVGRGVATATNTAVRGSKRAGDEAKAIARTVAAPTTRRELDDHPVDGADRYPDIFAEGDGMPPSPALAGAGLPEDDDEPMPFGADEAHDVFHDPIDGDEPEGEGSDVFTPVELPAPDADDDLPEHVAAAPAVGAAHEEDIHGAPGTSPRGGWKRPPKKSLK